MYLSFIEEEAKYLQEITISGHPHKCPLSHTPKLLRDYSQKCNTPLLLASTCSLKMISIVPNSFLTSLLPNTLPFLCFQHQHMRIIKESKSLRIGLGIAFRAVIHEPCTESLPAGSSAWLMPVLAKQMYHTCLANTHYKRMWFTVFSSCSQRKQGDVASCRPCLALLSDVHSLYCNANHMNIWQVRGPLHFHIVVTSFHLPTLQVVVQLSQLAQGYPTQILGEGVVYKDKPT